MENTEQFSFGSWPADTVITLANVPWNNDYRDVVRFADRNALNSYIDGLPSTVSRLEIDNVSHARLDKPVKIQIPFTRAMKYNYLRAYNPSRPNGDGQQRYYYFVIGVREVNPGVTELTLQLDIWQSFIYDIEISSAYVERGHIGIANSKQMDLNGRRYLSVPEGLDTGAEYMTISAISRRFMDIDLPGSNESGINILGLSTVDLNLSGGDVENPVLVSAKGGNFGGLPSGASFYVWENVQHLRAFMDAYSDKPWVLQGIISLSVIPSIARYLPSYSYNRDADTRASNAPSTPLRRKVHSLAPAWRDGYMANNVPERYRRLNKLMTAPYLMIEITTFTGQPLTLRPESWNDSDGTIIERASLVPPSQRVTFFPFGYNVGTPTGNQYGEDDGGDYLNMQTSITNFPQLPLVNNAAVAFLAANANTLAYQRSAADWSQNKALAGNQLSYDQTSAAMGAAADSNAANRAYDAGTTAIGQQQNLIGSLFGGASGVGSGAAGGAITGGPPGAAVGAAMGGLSAIGGMANAMLNVHFSNEQLAQRNALAGSQLDIAQGQAGYVRDTNKNLADWAANGDYSQAIAAINARVQDSALTPPSVVGQFGGDAMNIVNRTVLLSLRFHAIDIATMSVIGEYWLRYGYAINRWIRGLPSDLMAMSRFTYWKMREVYIRTGNMPESYKQGIRGIFEKGVTLWANPADIGVIDIANNVPKSGISYE